MDVVKVSSAWQAALSRVSWPALIGIGAGLMGLSALPMLLVSERPLIAAPLAIGAAAMIGVALYTRWQLDQLGLELSQHALRYEPGVVHIRARLGLGRTISGPEVEATLMPTSGGSIPLHTSTPFERATGAFTLTILEPDEAPKGRLHVVLRVHGGGKDWTAEASWDTTAIRSGRFEPPLRLRRGRTHLVDQGWDEPRGTPTTS